MNGTPGVNVVGPVFTIPRSAAVGVAIPTLAVPESGSPDTAPVPAALAVLVITVLGVMPALTVTSNVIVADAPCASVPRFPLTPAAWLPVPLPCENVRLPAYVVLAGIRSASDTLAAASAGLVAEFVTTIV